MKLRFDPHTLAGFEEQGITDVRVGFKKAGCCGLKLFFEPLEVKEPEFQPYPQDYGITVWATKLDAADLDGGQIAVANGRTYFVSPETKARCGCGTSISFTEKKVDLSMAKIHRLSEKLGNIPEIKSRLKK